MLELDVFHFLSEAGIRATCQERRKEIRLGGEEKEDM